MKKVIDESPLEQFEGYDINRESSRISFGCGEVSLMRKDLNILLEMLESPHFKKNKTWIKDVLPSDFGDYDTKIEIEVDNIAKFMKVFTPAFTKQFEVFATISMACGSRFTFEEILDLEPNTLRRILKSK